MPEAPQFAAATYVKMVRSILTERPISIREMPDGTKAVFIGQDMRAAFAYDTWQELVQAVSLHRQLKLADNISHLPICP